MRTVLSLLIVAALVLFVTSSAHAAVIFSDHFNTLSGWNILGGGNGSVALSSATPNSTAPGGNPYLRIWSNVSNTDISVWRTISTSGYQNINLNYYRTTDKYEGNDAFRPEWGLDGSSWNVLETLINSTSDRAWAQVNWVLPSSANNTTIYLRYRVSGGPGGNSSVGDYGLLDSVVLSADSTGGGGVVPEPATLSLLGLGVLGIFGFKRRIGQPTIRKK